MADYQVDSEIGQGGMGMVLKAEHRRMERLVALKILSPAVTKSPDAVRAAKQILNNSGLVDVAAGLAEEAATTRQLLGSANQLEAITAQFEGRTPKFQDA